MSNRKFLAFAGNRSLQFDKCLWVGFAINGFTQFQKLIIQHALLIPLKTENYL